MSCYPNYGCPQFCPPPYPIICCATGPTGPIGAQGITGPIGPIGAQGETGPQGVANQFVLFNTLNRISITQSNSPYNALAGQWFIAVTGQSSTIDINLPSASSSPNNFYIIADETGNAGTYPININTTGGDTISGATQLQINTAYGNAWVYSVASSTKYFVLFTRP